MGTFQRIGAGFILLTAVSGVARAHEIGGRFKAPLPLSLLFGGAAVTVGLTAVMLAVTVEGPTRKRVIAPRFSISPPIAIGLRTTSRGVFFLAFVLTVATGLFGRQVQVENFATVFVWALWLKGVAILAGCLGSPWRIISPWRTLYDGLCRVEGHRIAVFGEYPSWLDISPALIGYVLWIGVVEILTAIPRAPRTTALLVIAYTMIMLVGGLAFGPAWFRNADAMAVFYRLFGRVAPVTAVRTETRGYRLGFRPPWQGCTRGLEGLALTAFVIATVYTVSFDGFTSTPEYQTLHFGLQNGFGAGLPIGILLYFVGFAGFLAAFFVTILLTLWFTRESITDWRALALRFAPTILPIAVAYEIAHNYPFVLSRLGQSIGVLWPFFGLGHGPTVELLGWLSVSTFWWSQVVLIVVGHIIAVVAAHYVALEYYRTARQARYAHVPLAAVMVGYTVLSLWIISRPVVA